jgi:hypothetical protein
MAKANYKTRRNDWQISGLIDEAQAYSTPTDRPIPAPIRRLALMFSGKGIPKEWSA